MFDRRCPSVTLKATTQVKNDMLVAALLRRFLLTFSLGVRKLISMFLGACVTIGERKSDCLLGVIVTSLANSSILLFDFAAAASLASVPNVLFLLLFTRRLV